MFDPSYVADMTPEELPDLLTPVTIKDLWNALLLTWEQLGVDPTVRSVNLKLAHIHLETGLKSCHNYNLGNVKSRQGDGHCWQYFTCGEELKIDAVRIGKTLGDIRVVSTYTKFNSTYQSVKIYPKHPWCRFAAFRSLEEGVVGQYQYLKQPKRKNVLSALMTGDPKIYNNALFSAGYYTASTSRYEQTLVDRLAIVEKVTSKFDWGDVV